MRPKTILIRSFPCLRHQFEKSDSAQLSQYHKPINSVADNNKYPLLFIIPLVFGQTKKIFISENILS